MSTTETKALVRRYYEVSDRRDHDAVGVLLARDCVAHQVGVPGPMDRAGFLQFAAMFYAAFPDGRHTFEHVVAEGNDVVTRGTFSGTHRGELLGIPPTGNEIRIAVVHVDRVVGGQIVEHWGQADMMGLMQQLGAIAAPGQAAS